MYLRKLILSVIILFALAFATGKYFDHLYTKRWNQLFFTKTNELIKGNTAYDIFITGNSRTHFGLNPFYIDSVTGYHAYNFGFGGADMTTIGLVAALYNQQHPAPKLAIIGVDVGMLIKTERLKTMYHFLYYLNTDTAYNAMKDAGFPVAIIKYVPFLKYAFLDEYNRNSMFVRWKKYPEIDHNIYKGFLNVDTGINNNPQAIFNVTNEKIVVWDSAAIYLENIIRSFKQKNTQVIFVYPPVRKKDFKQTYFSIQTDSMYNTIARRNKIPVLNFKWLPQYEDKYFVDEIHLNEPGTRIYSRQLADSLKQFLP